jgi:hypothetical protein
VNAKNRSPRAKSIATPKTDRKEQGRQIDPGEESIQASNDKYQTTWAVLWISKAPPKVFLALSY